MTKKLQVLQPHTNYSLQALKSCLNQWFSHCLCWKAGPRHMRTKIQPRAPDISHAFDRVSDCKKTWSLLRQLLGVIGAAGALEMTALYHIDFRFFSVPYICLKPEIMKQPVTPLRTHPPHRQVQVEPWKKMDSETWRTFFYDKMGNLSVRKNPWRGKASRELLPNLLPNAHLLENILCAVLWILRNPQDYCASCPHLLKHKHIPHDCTSHTIPLLPGVW